MLYKKLAKPYLFRMDAERAHHLIVGGLHKTGQIPGMNAILGAMWGVPVNHQLTVKLWNLTFPNPVGLAAGLDKNGEAVSSFSRLGFGFMEAGTITPKPQPGNEQPRLFRLPSDEALINRMGFNNIGAEAMAAHLNRLSNRPIPVAINIGKNKLTPNEHAEEDYRQCIRILYPYGDFFVVNISSPNTPDLRNLQHGDDLSRLLRAVKDEMNNQSQQAGDSGKPILVKIAPDLTQDELAYTIGALQQNEISGVIATNTTLSREGLQHANRSEAGGLSGKPLTLKATEIIRHIYRLTDGKLPIIGVGGIFNAQDAYDKIKAGASLVEVYTALIYEGPNVLREINSGLMHLLQRDGFTHITQAIGVDSK
jgi:dihydroorotate dehydrogenase